MADREFNPGDEVYVTAGGLHDLRTTKVSRVTKTMAIVGGVRYNRRSGWMIGGSTWSRSVILHPTPELDRRYAGVQRRRLARRLADAFRKWEPGDEAATAAVDELLAEWGGSDG